MSNNFCPVCDDFMFRGHKCPPLWHARIVELHDDDTRKKVYARTPEEAAEKVCEQYDRNGDYTVASNTYADVVVYDSNQENPVTYGVEVRTEPVYSAFKLRVQP